MNARKVLPVLAIVCAALTDAAEVSVVTPLMKKDLPDYPGKEGLVISVVYPPGMQGEIHRHDAHSFIYVLEGTVEMQVRGGPLLTLSAGQTFYEGPTDVHVVGRNPSPVQPAKLLVVLIKRKGADVVLPAQ